jgi:hypothetical protein
METPIEEARRMLLRMGRKVLGPLPFEIAEQLNVISDISRLQVLVDRLLEVRSWQELLAQ